MTSLKLLVAVSAVGVACAAAAGSAGAVTSTDVRVNAPQVAGVADSDTSARFPTNKQNETTVAVNPVDASHLIAGANDEQGQPPCGDGPVRGDTTPGDCSFFPGVGTDGVYVSSNGGQNWSNIGLIDANAGWRSSPFVSDGDPVIVYGPKPDRAAPSGFSYAHGARAYYVGLAAFRDGASTYSAAAKAPEYIVASYSDDDGLTWSAPVRATTKDNPNTFNDKNSAWVDDIPASPYFGRLYVGFTSFRSASATGGNAPVMVATSADGGTSFGTPQQLSQAQNNGQQGGRQGTDIASAADGTVYVAWEEGATQAVRVSRDGGRSFAKAVTIGPVSDIASPIPGANFRTDSFPGIAADPRPGSTTVWASWTTRSAAGGRVMVARSTDRGSSWGAPEAVSAASQGYAFFDSLDVAPTGRVDVGFQALRTANPAAFGTGNASIDAYYVGRGAVGWGTATRVSTVSSDPAVSSQNNLRAQFWGDYSTTVSTAGTVWFTWADDTRGGAGCPTVDAFQKTLIDLGLSTAEENEAAVKDAPVTPNAPAKPAPEAVCPGGFGNGDIRLAVVKP